MRVLFIAVVLVLACWLSGCAGKAYIDLRKPIYLVTEDSFFTGCEDDPVGAGACRKSRSRVLRDGVMQWLDYFEKDTRPFVGVVSRNGLVPYGTTNQRIHITAKPGGCDELVKGESFLACYYGGDFFSEPHINFTDVAPNHIAVNVMAHEFGHALGLDHYDNQGGSPSIMSKSVPFGGVVASTDIDRLCRIHRECPKRKCAVKVAKGKK